jgi:rhodanese-related sulfurtransferase
MAKKHNPGFERLCEAARTRVRELTIADVKRRLDAGERFHLVDVREDHEWCKGRLPHAVHLGRGILERDVESQIPDLKADIVLYCGGGYRSALAAESLQKMGYSNVTSMAGGYRGWTEAGHATETNGGGDHRASSKS